MSYLLQTDYTQISSITSMRVMVSAALLYTFTVLPQTIRFTIYLSALPTSSKIESKYNECTTTAADWSFTASQVHSFPLSLAEHKLP